MTTQEIYDSITFRSVEEGGRLSIRGGVLFSCTLHISKNALAYMDDPDGHIASVKEEIRQKILAAIFADRRKALMEAVDELLRIPNSEISEAVNAARAKLSALAKFQ